MDKNKEIKGLISSAKDHIKEGTRLTGDERLALLLSDGEPHCGAELANTAGWRFGAHIYKLRHIYGATINIYRHTLNQSQTYTYAMGEPNEGI